jgi:prolyl 4-hydroxylase
MGSSLGLWEADGCGVCTGRLKVTGFKDGMHANSSVETTKDLAVFTRTVEVEMLQLTAPRGELARKYKQAPGYFTPDGERLEKNLTALQNRIVFLFEGGQFIWPGVRVGHQSKYLSR